MKRIPAILAVLVLFSCSSAEKKATTGTVQKPDAPVAESRPTPGWSDGDTYTVHVSGASLDEAVNRARHQILKDIVNVRMLNNSRYTDITMIQEEFKKPLENGRVINPRTGADGIEIWFQIRDKGLREKFERK